MTPPNYELLNLQLTAPYIPGDTTTVPASTGIFRRTSQLPAVVSFAESRVESDRLNIASTPCSLGGEVDSTLSLLRDTKFGSVAVRGIDINPKVIEIASTGKYETRWVSYGEHNGVDETRRALEDRGFVVADVKTQNLPRRPRLGGEGIIGPAMQLLIDANPLRQEREVEFEEADLEEPEVLAPQSQDVVLANNLLYHLPTYKATSVLWNLANAIRGNGVLSLSDEPQSANNEAYPMVALEGSIIYRRWIAMASELMAQIFDLEPLAHDTLSGRPTILGKESSKAPKSSDWEKFQATLVQPVC